MELERDGEPMRVSGDVVVVSCGAANSARLLLIRPTTSTPSGLANGSDQVGRNYMFHNSKAMVALAHEPNTTVFQKTVSINDWYLGDAEFAYPMGNIQMTGKTNGTIMKGYAPLETFLMPGWSMDRIADMRSISGSPRKICPTPKTGSRWIARGTSTSATRPTTRAPPSTSPTGSPACWSASTCASIWWNGRSTSKAPCRSRRWATRPAPAASVPIRPAPCWILNCKAHELDNLYVVDTSFMPSIGAVNPSLTAIANALRVGDHLIERLR